MTRPAWLTWLLAEPRLTEGAKRQRWDYLLMATFWVTAIIEGLVRDNLPARWPTVAVVVVLATTMVWRRSHPLAALLTTVASYVVMDTVMFVTGRPPVEIYTMAFILLLMYTLARWDSGRNVLIGVAASVALALFTSAVNYSGVGDIIGGLIVLLVPFEAGGVVRYQRAARSQAVDRAKMEERAELARELHDTVAHRVSAIAIQAQVGRMLAGQATGESSKLDDALAAIEEEASRTLSEMRSMVGSLRDGETEVQMSPQQGVRDISALAAPGMWPDIDVTVDVPTALEVDAITGAALYRIAQESVTNAARHAANATQVNVTVNQLADTVQLVVLDNGTATSSTNGTDTGFGLLGMAERAEQLGGEFSAGSTPQGWKVVATIPHSPAPSPLTKAAIT